MPLWAQIAERLRRGIADGEFGEGDDLPSESQLIERFGVSRATVRSALGQLASEGLVERRSGKGTKVLPPQIELPLNLLTSFAEDMTSRGMRPGYGHQVVRVDEVPRRAALALEIEEGTTTVKLERELLANDSVIALSVSWMSPSFIGIADTEPLQSLESSLYTWLEDQRDVRIAHGTETIEAAVADAALAARLGISEGGAVLNASRVARATNGAPIEYVQRSYRADRYRYRVELVRP